MTTADLPAWATDPRGLPPAVQNRSGRTWVRSRETYAGFTPTQLEALHGPLTPLWPDTPPTPIDPADIKVGMRVRRVWERDGRTLSVEGLVSSSEPGLILLSGYDYLAKLGGWFLIADAPDPDAELLDAIAEATPDTAPAVLALIRSEQA